jgi:hypothetical protein
MTEINKITEDKCINVQESYDVNYWCEELNLRSEELLDIVNQVGPSLHDVRLHLAKRLLTSWPAAY